MYWKERETGAHADWLLLANCIDLDRSRLNFDCKFTCLSKTTMLMRLAASLCVECIGFCVGHLPSQNRLLPSHFRLLHQHLRGLRLGLRLGLVLGHGLNRRGGGRGRGREQGWEQRQRRRREQRRLELEQLCHLLEDNVYSSNFCKPAAIIYF